MNTSHYKKGFTLVETLVAITVLLLVVIGPMTVAQKGIQTAYFATEQATAVFLAQEAIEAVRELRDNNALLVYDGRSIDSASWVPSGCGSSCSYNKHATNDDDKFSYCSLTSTCKLFVTEEGEYTNVQQVGSTASPFTRSVTISELGSGTGIVNVLVKVSWKGRVFGGEERDVVLQTWIYDQYSRYE